MIICRLNLLPWQLNRCPVLKKIGRKSRNTITDSNSSSATHKKMKLKNLTEFKKHVKWEIFEQPILINSQNATKITAPLLSQILQFPSLSGFMVRTIPSVYLHLVILFHHSFFGLFHVFAWSIFFLLLILVLLSNHWLEEPQLVVYLAAKPQIHTINTPCNWIYHINTGFNNNILSHI